jgi:hypothetical protein
MPQAITRFTTLRPAHGQEYVQITFCLCAPSARDNFSLLQELQYTYGDVVTSVYDLKLVLLDQARNHWPRFAQETALILCVRVHGRVRMPAAARLTNKMLLYRLHMAEHARTMWVIGPSSGALPSLALRPLRQTRNGRPRPRR